MERIRIVLVTMVCALYSSLLFSQNQLSEPPELFLLPTNKGDLWLWGLVSSKGELILKPSYSEISGFVTGPNGEQISVVRDTNGKYGYINEAGQEIHPTILDNARSLTQMGVARFKKNGKWGYLNVKGDVVIQPQFDSAEPMENGFGLVRKGKKTYYIDASGNTKIRGPFANAKRFSKSGFAAVTKKEDGKWGVIDRSGKMVIKPKFSRIGKFSDDGFAPAAVGGSYRVWGLIDLKGKWVIEPQYKSLNSLNSAGLAVFYDNNYHAGVIDSEGAEIYKSRDSALYVYPNCDVMFHGYTSKTFASLTGKKIKTLNTPKYDWFSGFNSECFGLAVNDWQWGWLKRDGSFSSFPKNVVEPASTDINTFSRKFVPAITNDRKLVYLSQNGELSLTTKILSDEASDTLIVLDSAGKELWRSQYPAYTLSQTHNLFFKPGNLEFGFDESWLGDVAPVTEKLLNSKPQYFDSFSEEPYELPSDDFVDSPFGGIEMLAYHYLSETEWGSYYFMESSGDFSPQYDAIFKQLSKRYGQGFKYRSDKWEAIQDLNYYTGDNTSAHAWSLDKHFLILDSSSIYGDGDITSTLKLVALSKNKLKQNATEFDSSALDLIETSDESDDDIRRAVKTLANNTSNSDFVKGQAAQILELVSNGQSISEYDYLWTLYALLTAAYPELENGMQQDDYLKIADTAMHYLDNNGVGTWVYTDAGQFMMEVYRIAGNGAAWTLRGSQPEKALAYIEAALSHAREEDAYLNDTYVRILLNLGEQDRAFAIVKQLLEEQPDFSDFQDFLTNEEYASWLKSN